MRGGPAAGRGMAGPGRGPAGAVRADAAGRLAVSADGAELAAAAAGAGAGAGATGDAGGCIAAEPAGCPSG